ncbi:MAG: hypothetical protein ABIG44_13070 [Planctomycetota bacterium]
MVETDLPCAACGYNLRTLVWSSKCPECGRPVKHSAPLRGFRFHSLRSIRRARLGLGLLICVFLWYGLFDIALTAMFRFIFDLPFSLTMAVHHVWRYEWLARDALTIVAVFLLVQPFARQHDRLRPGLGWAAVCLALVGWLASVYPIVGRAFGQAVPSGMTWGASIRLGIGCGVEAALILLWIHLLRRIDRDRGRFLWWTMCLTTAVPVLLLCLTAVELVVHVVIDVPLPVMLMFEQDDDAFGRAAARLAIWWRDAGLAVFYIAMLLPLWLFVRRLNAAARARERECTGPLTCSPSIQRAD